METFIMKCLLLGFMVSMVGGEDCSHWSNWEVKTACTDHVHCEGERTDTRKRECEDESNTEEDRDIACDGKCKPCTAWSEWSSPYAERKGDVYGRERRFRTCFLAFKSVGSEREFRKALCVCCPVCQSGCDVH